MKAVIKLHEFVVNGIVNHTLINSKLECGGYLYGCSRRTKDGIETIITDMYYEKLFGTDRQFSFGITYLSRAKNYMYEQQQLGRKIKLVGCYHSHGLYQALFSPIDRMLQKKWMGNQATIIYSPHDNEMIGDIIMRNGSVLEARITTFNKDVYNLNSIANIAMTNDESDRDLQYRDGDRALTLKYKPKKR